LEIYADKHSCLRRNDDNWTLEEQLAGRQEPPQVQRAAETLGIEIIWADSPQAKGRIERAWGTFQDRLVSELRLAGVSTLDEANAVLERYRREHNRRFSKKPKDCKPAWRKPATGQSLAEICGFHTTATIYNDSTVRYQGQIIDLKESEDNMHRRKNSRDSAPTQRATQAVPGRQAYPPRTVWGAYEATKAPAQTSPFSQTQEETQADVQTNRGETQNLNKNKSCMKAARHGAGLGAFGTFGVPGPQAPRRARLGRQINQRGGHLGWALEGGHIDWAATPAQMGFRAWRPCCKGLRVCATRRYGAGCFPTSGPWERL